MLAHDDPPTFLQELARLLESPLLPVQSTIAREIGEDQPFVSNASRGKLRRVTERVTKLFEYASSRIEAEQRAREAARSADKEISEASDELVVDATTADGDVAEVPADSVSEEAMRDLRAYLDDGYDPRLIVEQLVVLRRAQQLRRPGRRRDGAVTPAP